MDERENDWVVPMTGGMALVTIGLLLLDTATWFLQYGVMGLGLLLTVLALYWGMSETATA